MPGVKLPSRNTEMKHFLLVVLLTVPLLASVSTRAWNESRTEKAAAEGEVVEGSLGRQIDDYLSGLASRGFTGAAMVVQNNKLVFLKGYGIADRGRKLPATHRTLFHIGSVSKQFTGAAVLKLEMEGKLRVSDPITKYFKDAPPDKRSITIHQLLTHTSGLPHRAGECSSRQAKVGRDEFVSSVLAAKLESAPGQTHLYSNDGYELLGAIIEIASGETYEQYLRKHLFAPAGMRSTGYNFTEAELARAARGYQGEREFMGVLNPTFRSETGPALCNRASGGILSTAEDMHKWYQALRSDRILSARAKEKLYFQHVPESPERTSFYGYGWALFKTARGTKLIAHNGGINDYFKADFRMYVDEGVAYFVAGNTAEISAHDASAGIAKVIFSPSNNKAAR
jgi:CubicO group peptidase (beta-lactamase class C family)